MNKKRLCIILGIIPVIFFLKERTFSPGFDWNYFNSLVPFVKILSLNEGIDLSICGGVDHFLNPQAWTFSPLNLLYSLFSPYVANILSWVLMSVLGFIYFYKISKFYKIDEIYSSLLSYLFISSSFFWLHLQEGHIVFRSFYLIPMVYYYSLNINIKKNIFILLSILTFMLLDGGIYPFIFSLFILLFNLSFKELDTKALFNKGNLFMVFSLFLILISKILPVLFFHSERMMTNDPETMSFINIIQSFFYPFNLNTKSFLDLKYRAHEYSLYIGVGLTLFVLLNLKRIYKIKEFYIVIFFFWIGTGLGDEFNPYTLFKKIPFLQQAHVQSRFFILFFFFLLIGISKLLSEPKDKKKNRVLFISFFEFLFISLFIGNHFFDLKAPLLNFDLVKKENVSEYKSFIGKPMIYGTNNLDFSCYEPANLGSLASSKYLFLDESLERNSKIDIEGARLTLKLEESNKKPFIINLKWLAGWECENCELQENDGLIQINTVSKNEYKLYYDPFYKPFVFITYFLGLFCYFFTWWKYGKL